MARPIEPATAILHRAMVDEIFRWWPSVRQTRDELPWRSTRDPWLTLLAEMMLTQTQVARVAERFVVIAERFPTAEACAKAPLSEVLALWVGLGYNRRAVALHRTAVLICERHGGEVPCDLQSLLQLPGVGSYTARAVLAFSFDVQSAVVDTNVGRVLARAASGTQLRPREAQTLADELVPVGQVRDWNLAIMDFGHLVCRSRSPMCESCVLASSVCRWQQMRRSSKIEIPDPAVGSGGVSTRQPTFEGSDRQGRGRLVRAACLGPLPEDELCHIAGWPNEHERALRIADMLVVEGIMRRDANGCYQLA